MKPCKNCIHHTACVTANPDMVKKTFECKYFEDKGKIKSALEKQIPKKPIKTPDNHKWFCPTCHNPIRFGRNHCCNCGQALN